MMTALNDISSEQANATEHMLKMQKIFRLCSYASFWFFCFYASDMILHINSNAAYLVKPKARSGVAGVFYLDNIKSRWLPRLDRAILIECKTLHHVVASVGEAETGGISHNAHMELPI